MMKRHFLLYTLILLLVICYAGLGGYAYWIEPMMYEVRSMQIQLNHWHPEHNGLKILLLSDLHQRNSESEKARLNEIIRTANALKPDLIFLLGDYMHQKANHPDNVPPEHLVPLLAKLKSTYGTYAVLGNHDWWFGGHEIRKEFEAHGINVLENSSAEIKIKGKKICLLGLPDQKTRSFLLRNEGWNLPEDKNNPVLVLSHSPDYFKSMPERCELMFAGHTHGGQVHLPLLGALVIPTQYHFHSPDGWFRQNGQMLFVTRGLGTSMMKIRFLCKPEINLITLSRRPEQTTGKKSGTD